MRKPALSLTILLALLGFLCGTAAAEGDARDWGVAIYMPYDNNLEGAGPVIHEQVKRGATSVSVVACIQADYTDKDGLRRTTFHAGKTEEARLPGEDSASEDTAIEFFTWFVKKHPCRRYVFVFVDHGGRLDEMCSDERPETPGKTWMSGKVMGEKLRRFVKEKIPGRLPLLFLQQCGRGSLENLYSFRETADVVMASPLVVGAPNTYYAAFLQRLGAERDLSGAELAATVAKEDRDYTLYAAYRGAALAELPARVDAGIAPLIARESLLPAPRQPVIYDVGEPIVDAVAQLRGLAAANTTGTAEVEAFAAWVREGLLVAPPWTRGRGGSRGAVRAPLSGVSIFAARSARELRRYAFLELYKASRLDELWGRIAAPTPTPSAPQPPTPPVVPKDPPAPKGPPREPVPFTRDGN